MLRSLSKNIIARIAQRHVAGSDIDDALQVCRWASDHKFSSILSLWLSGSDKNRDKKECFNSFKSNLQTITREKLDGYYSIKLSVLDYDFNLFIKLADIAREYNIRLHIDSLNPESAPTVFNFLRRASDYSEHLGCTLPSRWKRSLTDAEKAIDLGVAVRVVKGQWKDPYRKVNSRENYLAIVRKLAGRSRYVGIATHDSALAQKALTQLNGTGTTHELEQFFSLPLNGIKLAKKFQCPYRLYVAYGDPAIPYNYRFSLTRPALAAWMLSDFAFNPTKPWKTGD